MQKHERGATDRHFQKHTTTFLSRKSHRNLYKGIQKYNQCSAIIRRSSIDSMTALLLDVKDAYAKSKIADMVAVNVRGAFHGILWDHLLMRLRTQGWLENIVKWVQSFFQDGTAKIRHDRTVSDPLQVICGFPQGSPTSPILFLIFLEPAICLSQGHFGYADISVVESGTNLQECGQKLQL